jgi:hypothetical protein
VNAPAGRRCAGWMLPRGAQRTPSRSISSRKACASTRTSASGGASKPAACRLSCGAGSALTRHRS